MSRNVHIVEAHALALDWSNEMTTKEIFLCIYECLDIENTMSSVALHHYLQLYIVTAQAMAGLCFVLSCLSDRYRNE